jgi:hypothetical protein
MSLQDNADLDVGGSNYSGATATAAKNYLTTTKNWLISDGGPV